MFVLQWWLTGALSLSIFNLDKTDFNKINFKYN